MIKCNSCWKDIEKSGYLTACSHIFCETCARDHFVKSMTCPACNYNLKQNEIRPLDYASEEVELSLIGYPPEKIIESASKAMNFYSHQKQLECRYHLHVNGEKEKQIQEMEQQYQNVLKNHEKKFQNVEMKYNQSMNQMKMKEQENKYLQQQINNKKKEIVKVQEMYQSLKQKYDEKYQSLSNSANNTSSKKKNRPVSSGSFYGKPNTSNKAKKTFGGNNNVDFGNNSGDIQESSGSGGGGFMNLQRKTPSFLKRPGGFMSSGGRSRPSFLDSLNARRNSPMIINRKLIKDGNSSSGGLFGTKKTSSPLLLTPKVWTK